MPNQTWEERFDEEYPELTHSFIKDFVREVLAQERNSLLAAFEEIIGEDEASDVREDVPQWCSCGSYPHGGTYCNNCRKKVVYKTEKHSTGIEFDRNELRAEQRTKLNQLKESNV